MDELYLTHILEHAKHPKNQGVLTDYDLKETGTNPSCGDELTLYLKLTDNKTVSEVSFEGEGCAISQAATSLLTEKIKGLNIQEINSLTEEDIVTLLGTEVNPARAKCAHLSLVTLKQALKKSL